MSEHQVCCGSAPTLNELNMNLFILFEYAVQMDKLAVLITSNMFIILFPKKDSDFIRKQAVNIH